MKITLNESFAIILSAGFGSRLHSITKSCPKSLILVNGRAILDYQIRGYLNAGLAQKNILVVTGYKSNMIESFLARHYPQIRTIRNSDYATTNNMHSLYLALKSLPLDTLSTLFVNNADCLYEESLIKDFVHCALIDSIAIESGIYNDESMKISINTDKSLCNIAKDIPPSKSDGISTDLYKFSALGANALFEIIKDFIEVKKDLTQWSEVAFPPLFRQVKVYPHDIDSKKWVEVDNEYDLALADRVFSDFDLGSKRAIICDMDGTLCVGDKPLQNSIDFIKRAQGDLQVYFLTNNTSKIPSDYVAKLQSFGIITDINHIITPLNALIEYLRSQQIKSAYLVANDKVTHFLESNLPNIDFSFDKSQNQAVILTYDTQITYSKLQNICILLNNTNAEYIATHKDIFCPSEWGAMPDIGSYIELLSSTTTRTPSIIFGKPNIALVESLLSQYDKSQIAIIGDRIYTDKALADNMDCDFICTLTGETQRADLQSTKGRFPSLVVRDLGWIDSVVS